MRKIQSTCNLCALACNIDFHVEGGEIKKVTPTTDYPVNKGFCCIKGLNLDKQQTKIKARKSPLLRDENGEMKEVSWEKGIKTFVEKMTSIQDKYGKESVAYISTGQMTTEEMALLGHVGRNYMGMHGDGNTRLCMATSVVAHKQSFGFDAPPYTLNDAELSDTIILIGANPVIAHPVFWGRIRTNKEAKIITIDPRKSETAMNSHLWIDIKPKADLVLMYTLANVIIENNWVDKKYIEEHTEGFEEFKNHVSKFTLDNVEKVEILPYHPLGVHKYEAMGQEYKLQGVKITFMGTEDKEYLLDIESTIISQTAPSIIYQSMQKDNVYGYQDGNIIQTGLTGYVVEVDLCKYDPLTGELVSRELLHQISYEKRDVIVIKIENQE